MDNKAFRSTDKNFQMTFRNGYTLSVIFGERSYSDQGESTAEVAAWHSREDHWLQFVDGAWQEVPDGRTAILGYQTPDQVAELIQALKNFQLPY